MADVDAVTGAAPHASLFTEERKEELQRSEVITLPLPIGSLFVEAVSKFVFSPGVLLTMIPILLQGDESPAYVKEATDSKKNEKHGDGGRALAKEKDRIGELENTLQNNITKKQKQRIKNKIKNIRNNGQQNRKGEEHGRQNKR